MTTESAGQGPRKLSKGAIAKLLNRGLIASLATVDSAGRPHTGPSGNSPPHSLHNCWTGTIRMLFIDVLFTNTNETNKIRINK